jgi:hypothetical protein
MKADNGDWLVVEPVRIGDHRRRGLVLDIRGPDGEPPYLVRWSDTGHESLFFPGEGTRVVSPDDIARYAQG